MLQEQYLHSGQWPGDLHRQANGAEQTGQREQWKREVWTNEPSSSYPIRTLLTLSLTVQPHSPSNGDGDDDGDGNEGVFSNF